MTILAVTGLQRERRILAGGGVEVVLGGDDIDARAAGKHGVISIGIAGALATGLKPGDWVVADAVRDGDDILPVDGDWTARLLARLPGAKQGTLLGVDTVAATAAEKGALRRISGAIAVDMESHRAARVARRHGLPFTAARVISDAAHRTLPPAARVGMRADGGVDLPAVLRSLLLSPWQLPALMRTGLEAETAFRSLLRGLRLLGHGLAAPPGANL
ncbi:hopanoid-associated phosphorylase [Rhodospirillales bacterium URHD0017]|nr:hopanoid-associated phosphorylase [Rhodospirillales bacterium URHD0017]